jgi:hypothetical protein
LTQDLIHYRAYASFDNVYEHGIKYVADQPMDGIDWMEKVTGRKFNGELFFKAGLNDVRSTYKWAEVCMLDRAVPAPLDEKSISLRLQNRTNRGTPSISPSTRSVRRGQTPSLRPCPAPLRHPSINWDVQLLNRSRKSL